MPLPYQAWRRALDLDPNNIPALSRLVRHYKMVESKDRPPEFELWTKRVQPTP